jgi:hypothetical protein
VLAARVGPEGLGGACQALMDDFFFFFFTVMINQEPLIVKLHDRMSKLDLRAKQPQLQI